MSYLFLDENTVTRKQIFLLVLLLTSMRGYAGNNSNLTRYLSNDSMKNTQALYDASSTPEMRQNALLQALGWINDPNGVSVLCQTCGGYYDESHFPLPSSLSISAAPTVIKANPPVSYQLSGNATFNHGVVVQQPGRIFYATHAVLIPDPTTGKLDRLHATGGTRMEQSDALMLAQSLDADLDSHHTELQQVDYLFKVNATTLAVDNSTTNNESPVFTGFAHGTAESVTQVGKHQFVLKHVKYSTCAPTSRQWELASQKLYIDQDEGQGHAYNTFFEVHDVPLLYFPYFTFPTNNQRKSGFLYTMASTAPGGGLSLPIPYYFNLAPNFDDTFTPDFYTQRGILFINNFRYLTASSLGNIQGEIIPYDQEDNNQTRYSYTINDNRNYGPNWSSAINFNQVSDQNFLADFNILGANQVLLNKSGALNYQSSHWTAQALLQSYQVVNPTLLTANTPYNELPSLSAKAQYPDFLSPLSFSLATSYVNFQKLPQAGEINPVDGQRLNFMPSLSVPMTASYGYLTPNLTWDSTLYTLENNLENNFPQTTPSINVPIFDIDSSLYFDRSLNIGSNSYTQTLSPRLFYLYVPYENQNDIPIFDTSINTFSFNQLFTTNRFSGLDRIGDANQLSYALTTNINNAQGAQIIGAGIGQIYYFENRQVSLCQNTPGSTAPCIQTENPYYNESLSDVASYFSYNFNPQWSFVTNITYNPNIRLLDSQSYNIQYLPTNNNLLNIGLETNRQNYSLLSTQQIIAGTAPPTSSVFDGSFVYNISTNWATVASVNYSIENNGMVSAFGGIQYNSCCWALRLMAYRYVVGANPNTPSVLTGPTNTVYMVQFLLKGLGSAGDQMNGLLTSIPGYNNQLGF